VTVARAYEVDASSMCDVLSGVPGVEDVSLEFDSRGTGVLRVRLRPDVAEDEVVGAAVAQLHRQFGVGLEGGRLRLTGPSGRTVVAVVEPHRRDHVPAGPRPAGPRPAEPRSKEPRPAVPGLAPDPAERPVPERRAWNRPSEPSHNGTPRSSAPHTLAAVPSPPEPDPQPGPSTAPQVDDEPAVERRLVLDRVEVATGRMELWATVQLRAGDLVHTGTASATATGTGSHRAVVAATARAAESALGGTVRLDVEAVDLIGVGADQVGVVVVTLLTDRGVDRLTGAALFREDGMQTLVRATLDALNRRTDRSHQGRH
jgi:hypothetical protein